MRSWFLKINQSKLQRHSYFVIIHEIVKLIKKYMNDYLYNSGKIKVFVLFIYKHHKSKFVYTYACVYVCTHKYIYNIKSVYIKMLTVLTSMIAR